MEFEKDYNTIKLNKIPDKKTIRIKNKTWNKYKLYNERYVYLKVSNFKHPVCITSHQNFGIPLIFRRLVKHKKLKNIEMEIEKINTAKPIQFLSEFRPHIKNNSIAHYDLFIHKLIRKRCKLKLFINGKHFYGTLHRDRIDIGKRILNVLQLEPNKEYQFSASIARNNINNEHLFEKNEETDFSSTVKEDFIEVSKLIPDFEINDSGNKIEIHYKRRCKDSKKMKVAKHIYFSDDLFRLLGLFQAEGTKTKLNYLGFTNTNEDIICYYKNTFSNLFKIDDKLWKVDIQVPKKSKNVKEINKYWANKLKLTEGQILIYPTKRARKPLVVISLGNNTIRELFYRLLDLIKYILLRKNEWCGPFISGVLAGDGYLCICKNKNRVKRIELYFNPKKMRQETLFYLDCLRKLGINNHYLRIVYSNESKNEAQEILTEVRNSFKNSNIRSAHGIHGIGGTIIIHRKSDIEKISPYKPFYPNNEHFEKFCKCW